MNETSPSVQEISQTLVREIRMPGCGTTIREITSESSDVQAMFDLEQAINAEEYAEKGEGTVDDIRNWLIGGVTRNFDSLNPGSRRRAAVGTEEGSESPEDSMIIATTPLNEAGKLAGYTYIYRSDDFNLLPSDLQEKYSAENAVDLSYVTAAADPNRNVKEISESLLQTSILLAKRSIGMTVSELSQELTPEQLKEAQQKIAIFVNSSTTDRDTNYRTAVEEAGFKEIHKYTQKDDVTGQDVEYAVYTASPQELSDVLKRKTQPAGSTN